VTKNQKILERYNKYIAACKKRCEDADVSLGRNRIQRIKSACQTKIIWEEGGPTIATLNLIFLLIYGNCIADIIPDGVGLLSKIPKDNIYNQPVILKKGEHFE